MPGIDTRLAEIRGSADPKRHNARTLAALTTNPACSRRAVLDGAGVDKEKLARQVRFPTSIGKMSKIAVLRGHSFEEQVKAQGGADMLRLLREALALPIKEASFHELGIDDGEGTGVKEDTGREVSSEHRYLRTRRAFEATASTGPGAGTMFSHPMLRLQVGGVWAYLEPDLVAFQIAGKFHVVEIKSFPIIDGAADPGKVAMALRQSAVYVIALQNLMEDMGHSRSLVSMKALLVCPKDFTNQATAALQDVSKEVAIVRRQLTRIDHLDVLLAALPDAISFELALDAKGEPMRPADELDQALHAVEARYHPECLNNCELGRFCRNEAWGSTNRLGRNVREDLGGVDSIKTAISLATGGPYTDDLRQAAELLRATYAMRAECLQVTS